MRTIEEKNLIIAEFMGYKLENVKGGILSRSGVLHTNETLAVIHSTGKVFGEDMKYHTSWDWLMPVVEAIYNTGLDEQNTNEIGDVTHALLDVNINALHNAVVEFIEMYNQQN